MTGKRPDVASMVAVRGAMVWVAMRLAMVAPGPRYQIMSWPVPWCMTTGRPVSARASQSGSHWWWFQSGWATAGSTRAPSSSSATWVTSASVVEPPGGDEPGTAEAGETRRQLLGDPVVVHPARGLAALGVLEHPHVEPDGGEQALGDDALLGHDRQSVPGHEDLETLLLAGARLAHVLAGQHQLPAAVGPLLDARHGLIGEVSGQAGAPEIPGLVHVTVGRDEPDGRGGPHVLTAFPASRRGPPTRSGRGGRPPLLTPPGTASTRGSCRRGARVAVGADGDRLDQQVAADEGALPGGPSPAEHLFAVAPRPGPVDPDLEGREILGDPSGEDLVVSGDRGHQGAVAGVHGRQELGLRVDQGPPNRAVRRARRDGGTTKSAGEHAGRGDVGRDGALGVEEAAVVARPR